MNINYFNINKIKVIYIFNKLKKVAIYNIKFIFIFRKLYYFINNQVIINYFNKIYYNFDQLIYIKAKYNNFKFKIGKDFYKF